MVTSRPYNRTVDFDRVSRFLMDHHQPHNSDGNWLQPAWEYMHHHPALDQEILPNMRLWERDEEIVAVCHPEWCFGEAFFQLVSGDDTLPDRPALVVEMVDHAEKHLRSGETALGTPDRRPAFLHIWINDFDTEFQKLAEARGFSRHTAENRPVYRLDLVGAEAPRGILDPPQLPDGFRLQSLADDNDLTKMDRVLWRGFNHPGEPPPEGIEDRKTMQSGPNFRLDLTIVTVAPSGDFVSFSGTWYEPQNCFAYVEPVAADPDFRRMGLGKAAVLEGARRCAALGATVAYVGSDQPFYQAIGFRKNHIQECWRKEY